MILQILLENSLGIHGKSKQEQTWNAHIISSIQSPSYFWSVSNLEETIHCNLLVMMNTAWEHLQVEIA